jgi:hypothetical protein
MNDAQDIRVALRAKGFVRQPDGSYSKVAPLAPAVSHPVVERDVRPALEASPPAQEGGASRLTVRITRHACRVLDADNFAGGTKHLVDALRHERIIPNDDPASIRLEFEQVHVNHRAEEGVEIVIEQDSPS